MKVNKKRVEENRKKEDESLCILQYQTIRHLHA